MRRTFPLTLVLVALAALPALASEASVEHGHAGPDWIYLFYHSLGLSLLIGVLVYYTREPLKNFLLDRSDGIRRQIEGAETALAVARAEADELRAQLARASDESETFVREAADQAEAERTLAMERARQAAERIIREARRAADQEIARARRELQDEAARLATTIAAELLRERMTPEDDRRLISEFVEQVGRRS